MFEHLKINFLTKNPNHAGPYYFSLSIIWVQKQTGKKEIIQDSNSVAVLANTKHSEEKNSSFYTSQNPIPFSARRCLCNQYAL